jgi:hypothetical protein
MAALAESVEFVSLSGGGTEVRMRFAASKVAALRDGDEALAYEAAPVSLLEPDDTVALTVGPPRLATEVLQRVLAALAARARFSTDRISNTQRLAQEIVAHIAHPVEANRLTIGVSVAPRELELTVGPLRVGSSLDGLAPTLDRFTDDHDVARGLTEVLAMHPSANPSAAKGRQHTDTWCVFPQENRGAGPHTPTQRQKKRYAGRSRQTAPAYRVATPYVAATAGGLAARAARRGDDWQYDLCRLRGGLNTLCHKSWRGPSALGPRSAPADP